MSNTRGFFFFPNVNFKNTNFSYAKLNDTANLNLASTFENAIFNNSKITSTTANSKSFENAKFENSALENATFQDCNLMSAKFSDANLKDVDFTDSDLSNANFQSSTINDVNFTNSDLSSADFLNASIKKITLSNANISGATFDVIKNVIIEGPVTISDDTTLNYLQNNTIRITEYDSQLQLFAPEEHVEGTTYQWLRGETAIEGATGHSYTPSSEDNIETIKVTVTTSTSTETKEGIRKLVALGEHGEGTTYQWKMGAAVIQQGGNSYTLDNYDFENIDTIKVTIRTMKRYIIGRESTDFQNAILNDVDFSFARFYGNVVFSRANLSGMIQLNPIVLEVGATLELPSSYQSKSFGPATVLILGPHLNLSYANLGNISFRGIDMGYCTLTGAILDKVDFDELILSGPVTFQDNWTQTFYDLRVRAPVDDSNENTYTWKRGTEVIEGACAHSYRLTAEDLNHNIMVEYTTKDSSSKTTFMVIGKVGTVINGPFPYSLDHSYRWMRGEEIIGGATDYHYTLSEDDLGYPIYLKQTINSTETKYIMVGSVGVKLTAPTLSDEAVSYQWMRGGVNIDEATSESMMVSADDMNEVISVSITTSTGATSTHYIVNKRDYVFKNGYFFGPEITISGEMKGDFSGLNMSNMTFTDATFGTGEEKFILNTPIESLDGASLPLDMANFALTTGGNVILGPNISLGEIDFSDVRFSEISLSNLSLGSITLNGAYLSDASFINVDLSNVSLGGAIMASPLTNDSVVTLPQNYNLVNNFILGPYMNLSNADLSSTSMAQAHDVTGLILTGAVLSGMEFTSPSVYTSGSPPIISDGNILTDLHVKLAPVEDDAQVTYQWKRGSEIIVDATDRSYFPTGDDTDQSLSVSVKKTVSVKIIFASEEHVAGTTYQWLSGETVIEGATEHSYTLTSDDNIETIKVTVTTSSSTETKEGILKLFASEEHVEGATYQWLRGETEIEGATEHSYTLTEEDNNLLTMNVEITYPVLQQSCVFTGTDMTFNSIPFQSVDLSSLNLSRCTFVDCDFSGANFSASNLTGCAFERCTLSEVVMTAATNLTDCMFTRCTMTIPALLASTDSAETKAGILTLFASEEHVEGTTYQWLTGETDIEGATEHSYAPTSEDDLQTIMVTVTTSSSTETKEGLLKLLASEEHVEGTTYQWLNGDTEIAGATGHSYTPSSEDNIETIQVTVTNPVFSEETKPRLNTIIYKQVDNSSNRKFFIVNRNSVIDGSDISGYDFENKSLSETIFKNVDMSNVDLSKRTILTGLVIAETISGSPTLPEQYSYVSKSGGGGFIIGDGIAVENADLSDIVFDNKILKNMKFLECSFGDPEVIFSNTEISGCSFQSLSKVSITSEGVTLQPYTPQSKYDVDAKEGAITVTDTDNHLPTDYYMFHGYLFGKYCKNYLEEYNSYQFEFPSTTQYIFHNMTLENANLTEFGKNVQFKGTTFNSCTFDKFTTDVEATGATNIGFDDCTFTDCTVNDENIFHGGSLLNVQGDIDLSYTETFFDFIETTNTNGNTLLSLSNAFIDATYQWIMAIDGIFYELKGITTEQLELSSALYRGYYDTGLLRLQVTHRTLKLTESQGRYAIHNRTLFGRELRYGLSIAEVSFTSHNLNSSDFKGCRMDNCTFELVSFHDCNFIGEEETHISLNNTQFIDCDFRNVTSAHVTGIDITGIHVVKNHIVAEGVLLTDIDFTGEDFEDCNMKDINIDSSNFTNATFKNVRSGGITGSATFSDRRGIFNGHIFAPEVLVSGDFSEQIINDFQLNNSDFTGSDFQKAQLTNVDLSHSNLLDVNFELSKLTNVNISHALNFTSLVRVEASSIRDDSDSVLPSPYYIHKGYILGPTVIVRNADFTGSDFRNGNFRQAIFVDCIFENSSFRGAKCEQTTFIRCNVQGANFTNADLQFVRTKNISGTPKRLPQHYFVRSNVLVGPDVDLSIADLRDADLTFLNLKDTILSAPSPAQSELLGFAEPEEVPDDLAEAKYDPEADFQKWSGARLKGSSLPRRITNDYLEVVSNDLSEIDFAKSETLLDYKTLTIGMQGGTAPIFNECTMKTFQFRNFVRRSGGAGDKLSQFRDVIIVHDQTTDIPRGEGVKFTFEYDEENQTVDSIDITESGSNYAFPVIVTSEFRKMNLTFTEANGKVRGSATYKAERCATMVRLYKQKIFKVNVTAPGEGYFLRTDIDLDNPTSGTAITAITDDSITVSDASNFRKDDKKFIVIRGRELEFTGITGNVIFLTSHRSLNLEVAELVGQKADLVCVTERGKMKEIVVNHGGFGYTELPELFIDDPFMPTYENGDTYPLVCEHKTKETQFISNPFLSGYYVFDVFQDDGLLTLQFDAPESFEPPSEDIVYRASVGNSFVMDRDQNTIQSFKIVDPGNGYTNATKIVNSMGQRIADVTVDDGALTDIINIDSTYYSIEDNFFVDGEGSEAAVEIVRGGILNSYTITPFITFRSGDSDTIDLQMEELVMNVGTSMNHVLFENIDLRKYYFRGMEITSCKFKGVNMRSCDMMNAKFTDCAFIDTDLTGSLTTKVTFIGCSFDDDCDLTGINPNIHVDSSFASENDLPKGFKYLELDGTELLIGPHLNMKPNEVSMEQLQFELDEAAVGQVASAQWRLITVGSTKYEMIKGNVFGPNAKANDIRNIDVSNRTLENMNFKNITASRFHNTVFRNCTFEGRFDAIELSECSFTSCNLSSITTLQDPLFKNTIFTDTILPQGTKLLNSGFILGPNNRTKQEIILKHVDLTGLNLDRTDLTNATLTGVHGTFEGTPILPPEYALIGGRIIGPHVHVSGTVNGDLTSATLRGITSSNVVLAQGAVLPPNYSVREGYIVGPDTTWI